MKTLFSVVFFYLFLLLPLSIVADDTTTDTRKVDPCAEFVLAGLSDDAIEKRGCCSHYKGVCGCSGAR